MPPLSIADSFRLQMMRHLIGISSFTNSWPSWQPHIQSAIGTTPSGLGVFNLGDHLSSIFRSRVVGSRSNAAVSQGGTAWECLVCWYMNLVFFGTDVIVVRPHNSFLPAVLKDALSVNIQNVSTNTESDLVAFQLPNSQVIGQATLNLVNQLLTANAKTAAVCVVQSKTNCNDNSQIPMLWDLIYNSTNFRIPNVSVGKNGVSPSSFQRFAYAFVTVPTSRGAFKPSSLPVLRVRGLTGGNYWGGASRPGTARSLNEFFATNFPASFSGTVQNHVQSSLIANPTVFNKFLSLNF